jgi:hypothetical protein
MCDPKAPDEAVVEQAHTALASAASVAGASNSKRAGMVSRHVMGGPVSFANLASMHEALKRCRSDALGKVQDFVGTSGKELVYSARFDCAAKAATAPPPMPSTERSSRKRRRDDDDLESLEHAVDEARKKVKNVKSIAPTDVDAAEAMIARALQTLRGPSGERVVQSYGILPKKLSEGEHGQKLIVALRCMPGVAISIVSLRSAMGGFWADGLLSIETESAVDAKLPCTTEGQIAEEHGNASLLIVTSAPRASRDQN